jgi:hypothetical protein
MKTKLCIALCIAFIACGAVWTDQAPKTYPDRARFLKQKAEELKRNIDPNDFMYKVADEYVKRANKYLRYPNADVNRDGVVDMNDMAKVAEYMGNDGRELNK